MDYLGLFCLGAFVGTIATFGMGKVASLRDWQTVLSLTLPAVLSGAAMVFIDRFKYSPAFGSYPLGLVVALLWAYTQKSIDNLRTGPTSVRILALLHLSCRRSSPARRRSSRPCRVPAGPRRVGGLDGRARRRDAPDAQRLARAAGATSGRGGAWSGALATPSASAPR
jgi:hypothetical protein